MLTGERIYIKAASNTADTIGDVRTDKDATGQHTQICTGAGATKGAGTWVTIFSNLATGGTKIGAIAAGNYTEFEPDGTHVCNGNATGWDDDNLDPSTLTGGGTLPSSILFAATGLHIAGFTPNNTTEIEGKRELPHKYKLGSAISFHAHCYPNNTNTGVVRLGLEYLFTQEGIAITTSTTIYIEFAASGTAWAKQSQAFANITPPNELGVQFHFRFFRDGAHVNDTFTGDLGISTIGYHYETDTPAGSRQITTK
jgi:hypothetical protein